MFIIAGKYRGQKLTSPKGSQTRPTASRLREALFNICQHKIEGASFLDLFAGSGAMGFEALSRGAKSSTFIDIHKESTLCIKSNVERLNVQNQTQVHQVEAIAWLKKQNQTFDIIYADPPYKAMAPNTSTLYSAKIIEWVDTHPLLNPGGILFIEEDFDFQPRFDSLKTLTFLNSRRYGQAALQQYQLA